MDKINKIRDSFENMPEDGKVPPIVWDNISKKLDITTVDTNKIKQSFETINHNDDLQQIWSNIDEQLEINTVWSKINRRLNARSKMRAWKKRGMNIGIAAIAFLWLKTCMPDVTMLHKNELAISINNTNEFAKTKIINQKKGQKEYSVKIDVLNSPHSKNKVQDKDEQFDDSNTNKISSKHDTDTTSKTVVSKHLTKTDLSAAEKINSPLILEVNNSATKRSEFYTPVAQTTITTKDIDYSNNTIIVKNQATEKVSLLNKQDNQNYTTQKQEAHSPKQLLANALATLKPQSLFNIIDSSIVSVQTLSLKKQRSKSHFEVGLVGKAGSSVLLGQTTNKALELTSMIKTKIRPSGGVGVSLAYFFAKNNGLILSVFPVVSVKQYFGGYSTEGRFYEKEIKLDYMEFFISYQRNLMEYKLFNKNSWLYVRLDYNLGYLNKSEEIINNEHVNTYKIDQHFEHRFGLSIGNKHALNKFSIEYGINSHMSLHPSFNNINSISTSNTLLFGAYLGINYLL